ncbi:MAG: hypothetical protein IJ631_02570 [Schwartzia sp.]|nr:hypothetical protein [Schwartzia sp. (in: firmicutes)]
MEGKIKCPVCGEYAFEEEDDFDVCDICYWENDGYQMAHPDYNGGANKMSLNEARAAWKAKKKTKAA